MSKHKVEIDVSLKMDGLSKDFDALERKAKSGTKSTVSAVNQLVSVMEDAGKSAKGTGQDFEKAADNMEKSSKEAADDVGGLKQSVDETKNSTERLRDSEQELGKQSRETGKDQEELGEKTEETRQKVEHSRKSFLSWHDVAETAVKSVATAAGILFTSMGAVAGISTKFGTEYKQASNTIQASTVATKEEMEGLREVMKNVYAGNFGEDMNEVAEAVSVVKKSLGGTEKQIQQVTEAAFGFRDTFGYDIPESTRAASMLMKTFGTDALHAYDLMAKGAQKGLDFSEEMLDSITEYAPQFAKAGLSAEQMFNIMASGYEAGAWNLDKVGDAVKELNIRLVDGSKTTAEGLEMIGLNADEVAKKMSEGGDVATETYKQVVKGLAEMDDKQAQNIAGVNLFGTMWEDLGPGVVEQLAVMEGAYDNVKGTMEEINQVKYDDAGSALEALKRKAEVSLLLPISENIMPAISGATEAAIGYIDKLANAYESEGVHGLVEEAGEIFADIATNAAEQAPEMAEVAVSFVDNAAQGIKKNRKKLADAGIELTKTLCSAAVKLLPKELQEPVEDAMDDLVDSITGGGIRNGVKTFSNIFKNGFEVVTKITKTVLPPFIKIVDKAADNLDVIAIAATSAFAAFKSYKVVTETNSVLNKGVKAWKAASDAVDVFSAAQLVAMESGIKSNATMTAGQTLVGLLTGKITLATAAQTAWNAILSANPIGLVITAVGALAAGLVVYKLATDDSKESQYALTEEQKKANEEIHKQYKAYKELDSARKEAMESVNAEYGYLTELNNELKSLVDSNGQVKDGYEDRANFIINQLSESLDIEKEKIWEIIQANGDLGTSIEEVIGKKKAEALLTANEEAYTDAIKNRADALKKYTDQTVEFETAQKNYNSTQEAANKVMDEYYSLLQTSPDAANAYLLASQSILKEADEAETAFEEQKKALKEAEETYVGYNATIQNYEGLSSAIISGDATKISEAMLYIQNSFITAENGTKTSLENQVKNMQGHYAELKQAVEDGVPGVTQSMVDEAQQMVIAATTEIAKLPDSAASKIEALGPEASAAMVSALAQANLDGKLKEESKDALDGFVDGFNGLDKKTKKVWSQAWYGALEGLEGFEDLRNPAEDGVEVFLESLKKLLEVHSPSRAVKKIFSQVWPGAVEGLGEGESEVSRKGKSVISNFFTELGGDKVVQEAKKLGNEVLNSFGIGIESQKRNIDKTSKEIADSSNELLGSADTKETGSRKSKEYDLGVGSNKSSIDLTSKAIANSSDTLLGSMNTRVTGANKSSEYNSGLGSNRGAIDSTSRGLANTANSGMGAANTRNTGRGLGSEYTAGIGEKASSARREGQSLASNAEGRYGMRSVSAYSAGRAFGSGFEGGLRSAIQTAVSTAASLARQALSIVKSTLGIHSPSRETRKLGGYFGQGFELGVKDETKNAVKVVGDFARNATEAMKIPDFSFGIDDTEVQNAMKIMDDAVVRQKSHLGRVAFALGTEEHEKRSNGRLSKKEIHDIGKAIANVVNDHMEDLKIVYHDRELGRVIREVGR